MSWFVTATVGGALIGAIGSNMAAGKQAGAAQNAANIQENMFNKVLGNEQPFVSAGQGAQSQLSYQLGLGNQSDYGTQNVNSQTGGFGSLTKPFTLDDFYKYSPSYAFQSEQGKQGVLNGEATGGSALSGAAQKDLMSFNQGLSSEAFNNAFNMYQTQQGNIYSRLSGIAQTGQAAASNQATGASNFGGSIGQQVANVGSAQAGGIVGATNSLGNAAGALPWLMQGGTPAGTPTSTGSLGLAPAAGQGPTGYNYLTPTGP